MTDVEAIDIARAYQGPQVPVVYILEPDVCRECLITVDFRNRYALPVVSRRYDQTRQWLYERMP